MRTNNIRVEFEIPVRLNEPDLNGNIYTEEAILNSLSSYKNVPLVVKSSTGEQDAFGVIDNATYDENLSCVVCNGNIMFGGTDCLVSKSHRGENGLLIIDEFTISSVGISK